MNFMSAFSKVNADSQPAKPQPAETPSISSDDMKAYIDAKFEGFQNQLENKMEEFLKKNNIENSSKVETPKENVDQAGTEKEGDNNASGTDLSGC